MYEKECIICKVKFTTNKIIKLCCSEECRKERKRIIAMEYRKKKKAMEELNVEKKEERPSLDCNLKEMHKSGISYGKYIAIRDGYLFK